MGRKRRCIIMHIVVNADRNFPLSIKLYGGLYQFILGIIPRGRNKGPKNAFHSISLLIVFVEYC